MAGASPSRTKTPCAITARGDLCHRNAAILRLVSKQEHDDKQPESADRTPWDRGDSPGNRVAATPDGLHRYGVAVHALAWYVSGRMELDFHQQPALTCGVIS